MDPAWFRRSTGPPDTSRNSGSDQRDDHLDRRPGVPTQGGRGGRPAGQVPVGAAHDPRGMRRRVGQIGDQRDRPLQVPDRGHRGVAGQRERRNQGGHRQLRQCPAQHRNHQMVQPSCARCRTATVGDPVDAVPATRCVRQLGPEQTRSIRPALAGAAATRSITSARCPAPTSLRASSRAGPTCPPPTDPVSTTNRPGNGPGEAGHALGDELSGYGSPSGGRGRSPSATAVIVVAAAVIGWTTRPGRPRRRPGCRSRTGTACGCGSSAPGTAPTGRRATNEARLPTRTGPRMPAPSGPARSGIFSTPAARITGVASRKENRAASRWDRPWARPATMATPDRLMPGSSARICEAPTSTPRHIGSAAIRRSDRRSASGPVIPASRSRTAPGSPAPADRARRPARLGDPAPAAQPLPDQQDDPVGDQERGRRHRPAQHGAEQCAPAAVRPGRPGWWPG